VAKAVERHWTWHFPGPPPAVWQIMADTARFNEAAGFPKHEIVEHIGADGAVHYTGHAKLGPVPVVWRDIPIDWIENERFTHCNEFIGGPIARLCVTLTLSPDGEGTQGDYVLSIEPRNWLGRRLLPRLIRGAEKRYMRLVSDVCDFLAGRRDTPFGVPPAKLTQAAKSRVAIAIERIEAGGGGHGLASRIAERIANAQEVELMHMRPVAMAHRWQVPERHAIEACLESVRAGLLGMSWQILCPRCRGAKATAVSLEELPTEAHCESCNIDYDRDFARNVELTFHPAPAIRPVEHGEFCLFGPMSTPHVRLQQHLGPGETRTFDLALEPGPYRYRTLNSVGDADFEHRGGGLPALILDGRDLRTGAKGEAGRIVATNKRERPEVVVVESRLWAREALSAHRVTSMQRFRDLFSEEVLRPGDDVAVERIALMFTDLKGSTALYGRIGDAAAYHLVREHFAFLSETVREHQGAIVKTIGDAVMASFADPADALAAALAIQSNVDAFNRAQDSTDIVIKLGLHEGPAIAVTLNQRLDYFGTTVNMAARLQGESRGGDIVLSEQIAGDPAVATRLKTCEATKETAKIKGFSAPVSFIRLRVASADWSKSGGTLAKP